MIIPIIVFIRTQNYESYICSISCILKKATANGAKINYLCYGADMLSDAIRTKLLQAQANEITESHIYRKLADAIKDEHNAEILRRIAADEERHYAKWKELTGQDVAPSAWKIFKYVWISRIFGITFGIKLMEGGEKEAQVDYKTLIPEIPEAQAIEEDEERHEHELIALINEERLAYVGSVVLGLNDALVELTGALAGLTLALQNAKLIAMAGLITGIAASLSMAASEYLSTKTEGGDIKNPRKAAIYTGFAYIGTVILLILPFLLLNNLFLSLAITLSIAVAIIFFFTYYYSVAKDSPFKKQFLEMAGISLGVALFSFGIGYVIRLIFDIDV